MTHSGLFEREYFCHGCHLQYCGSTSYENEEGQRMFWREPCPGCGTESPCAVDTIGHAYCCIEMGKSNNVPGRDLWNETMWWREEWMKPEWIDLYNTFSWAGNHEPNGAAMAFWTSRIRRRRSAVFGWMKRRQKKDEPATVTA